MFNEEHSWKVLLEPVIEAMGCELLGIVHAGGRVPLHRIYIDRPGGVCMEDCARVGRQVEGVLAVRGLVASAYRLEVSSPGAARLLFNAAQCRRYLGRQVRLRLRAPLSGRRNCSGELRAVEEEALLLHNAEGALRVPLALVRRAELLAAKASPGEAVIAGERAGSC